MILQGDFHYLNSSGRAGLHYKIYFNFTNKQLYQLHWQIPLSDTLDSNMAHSHLGCCGWWWQGWGEQFVANCLLSVQLLPVVYFLSPVHLSWPKEFLSSSGTHLHYLFYLCDIGECCWIQNSAMTVQQLHTDKQYVSYISLACMYLTSVWHVS